MIKRSKVAATSATNNLYLGLIYSFIPTRNANAIHRDGNFNR